MLLAEGMIGGDGIIVIEIHEACETITECKSAMSKGSFGLGGLDDIASIPFCALRRSLMMIGTSSSAILSIFTASSSIQLRKS